MGVLVAQPQPDAVQMEGDIFVSMGGALCVVIGVDGFNLDSMSLFENMREAAARKGRSMADVCRSIGMEYPTLMRWKKYPPKNVQQYIDYMKECDNE